MKVLVLDGSAGVTGSALGPWVARFTERLRGRGAQARVVDLASLGIQSCTGCWSCWWATPGRCVRRDGMEDVYRGVLESELLVWAAPLVLGAPAALVKLAQDRMIPLIHPYFELVHGESHHRARYARYPALGLVVDPGAGDGPEDLALARRLFERFALNFKSSLAFFATSGSQPEEAADEADRR